jgi:hypothetical protein
MVAQSSAFNSASSQRNERAVKRNIAADPIDAVMPAKLSSGRDDGRLGCDAVGKERVGE